MRVFFPMGCILIAGILTLRHVLQKPITTMLKIGRTLQLHNPSIFAEQYPDIESYFPVEGAATYHPPTKTLVVRCAKDTYLSVPEVCLLEIARDAWYRC